MHVPGENFVNELHHLSLIPRLTLLMNQNTVSQSSMCTTGGVLHKNLEYTTRHSKNSGMNFIPIEYDLHPEFHTYGMNSASIVHVGNPLNTT